VNRQRTVLIGLLAAAATALLAGRGLSTLLVDRAWFAALGAEPLWREQILATLALKLGGWVAGTAFAFANLWAVRLTIESIAVPTRVADLELVEVLPARRLLRVTLLAAAAVGVLLTLPLDDWTVLSAAWRGERFGEFEGYLQRDLGFYVHWLPFETALYTWALVAIVVVTALVTVLYALTRSLRFEGRALIANQHVRRHLTVLGVLVLLLLSWSYRLDAYELLLWGSGPDGLFTAVDHRYTTRIDVALALATFGGALVVLRTGWIGQLRAAFITVTLVLVAALGFRQLGPELVRNGGLLGTGDARTSDYDATRALFTRRAWAVDDMPVVEPGDSVPADRRALEDALGAVALWDAGALARARQLIEPAATVVTAPVWQAGDESPEAIVVTRTVAVAPTWDVRLVPGAVGDGRGAPVLSRHPALRGISLPEPLVAPGLTGHRLVDADGPGRASAPRLRSGNEDGATWPVADPFADRRVPAARLGSALTRLAHAWATRDVSLLSGDARRGAAAVVTHLDVTARLRRLAPTLAQGAAIVPILHGTTLLWAIDLYSASATYPLSHRFLAAGEVRSAMRHAATALVDAETGAVRLVRRGRGDPIARTWLGLVPELVLEEEELPPALRQRLPVPTDGVLATSRAFSRAGSRRAGPTARYVPDSVPGRDPFPVAQGADGTIAWAVPLVDNADQLAGVLRARGGPSGGAEWHPLRTPRPRWTALTAALGRQLDSAIATLATERDGPLLTGTLRVLVRDGEAWLARPAYADEDGQWHLVAVAMASETTAFVVPITGGAPRPSRAPDLPPGEREQLRLESARRHFEALRDALQRSDWLRVGAALDSLGRTLDRTP
jgi:uncharacterized membrane protein (UPF0182 family)